MRTKTKLAMALGTVLLAVTVWFLGSTLMFLMFHSDWETAPHLLTLDDGAEALRIEVVDSAGSVLWAIENRTRVATPFVDYGSVPTGFAQLVPAVGKPRQLSSGDHLALSYCDDEAGFASIQVRVHSGELQYGLSSSGRRTDGVLCDLNFDYGGWTIPRTKGGA